MGEAPGARLDPACLLGPAPGGAPGTRLRPAAGGTAVRVRDGKTEVHNGPYIETREELAGYYLIDVPNLDAALTWAARCPGAAVGTMEVRPIWPMNEY